MEGVSVRHLRPEREEEFPFDEVPDEDPIERFEKDQEELEDPLEDFEDVEDEALDHEEDEGE